jgi:hypothetical protein
VPALRDGITLAVCFAAYAGYYVFADPVDKATCFYVMTGAALAWLGWCLRGDGLRQARPLAVFAGSFLLIEGAQQAGCGWLAWGLPPTGKDLCVMVGGETVYAVVFSLILAALWTWRAALWPSRQAPR